MLNSSYMYEVKFYLAIMIYKVYLQDKYILIDKYYDCIRYIYNDYIVHDNKNKSLMESISDYMNDKHKYIEEILKDCIEE